MSHELKQTMKTALVQVIAPQLQESLQLLTAPIMEIQNKVNEEIAKNPVLEIDETAPSASLSSPVTQEDTSFYKENEGFLRKTNQDEEIPSPPDTAYNNQMQGMIENSENWKDYFERSYSGRSGSSDVDEESRQYFFDSLTGEQSLQEYLHEQIQSQSLSPELNTTLELLLGYIDDYGYLRAKPAELILVTNRSPEEIKEALEIIHTRFDPPGVGAKDLRECLLIQLERKGQKDSTAWKIVDKYLKLLASKKFNEIASVLKVSIQQVRQAAVLITQLEPKPGRPFFSSGTVYVTPEIFVKKENGRYVVSLNDDLLPKLKINKIYKEMIGTSNSKETRSYILEKIRAGRFFITSLEQRQQTIRKIAEAIVDRQQEFMEEGPSGLRPLTMSQIAEVTGVHETTVSRAVSGKYIQTPRGIYELRYFFSIGLKSHSGEDISNTKIKVLLQEMVDKENKSSPLTDQEIVERFREKNINVARRTISKYRQELDILPSSLRKEI